MARPTLTNQAYWSKTEAELRYIVKDAGEAASAMRGVNFAAECKYQDQVNDACTVLGERSADRAIRRMDQSAKFPLLVLGG